LPVLFQYSCEILHIGKAAKTIIRNMYTQFDFVMSVRKCTRYDELSFIKLKWFIQESSLILLNTCKGSQSLIYYGIDVNLFWTFSVGPLIFIQPKFSIFTTYKKLHVVLKWRVIVLYIYIATHFTKTIHRLILLHC